MLLCNSSLYLRWGVVLIFFRLFQVKKQQHRRGRARQQALILQGGDDTLKEYRSTEPQLTKEGKKAFMLQGCFVNWNQQPTCHLQDFYKSATLSSRLGMIFLPLDNAIFVLIISMMWEVFYARDFWKVQYARASLLPWTSQSDFLVLLPFLS